MSKNSNLATIITNNNNNNSNCYLLSQNWWPQIDNSTIFHPISNSSLSSSCNTTRSSSCEEDVISISNNNNATNNLHQYQFLLGVDHENNTSSITQENAAASDDHNNLIWSQLLLNSSCNGTDGSINSTKNLLENNNNQDSVLEMSLLDGTSSTTTTTTLISSKSCFDNLNNNTNNDDDDDDDYSFHPYSNLLGKPLPINKPDVNYYYTTTNSNNNLLGKDTVFPMMMRNEIIGHHHHDQEVKLPESADDHENSRNLASICYANFNDFKPSLRTLNLEEHKKHGLQQPTHFSKTKSRGTISTCNTLTRSNGRAQQYNASEGKKRKSDDNSETNSKRQKNEISSAKIQVPKVKLADKITALQQIVSPFGKTDTASVLWETINYVRFLQEQIQLLSHAYMKSNPCKDMYWGGFERKEVDLRSRGLCLVPISFTPQIYHESNNGSDYLIPSYRGCLYR